MSLGKNQKVAEAYKQRFLEYGDQPKGVFWNNTETQELRFDRLLKEARSFLKEDFSILDVGSGTAAFHEYLVSKKMKHQFSGVEIVSEMAALSRNKFPEIKIYEDDFLSWKTGEQFDLCTLSGVFNLHADTLEWKDQVFETVKKMFSLSRVAASFNFLTALGDYQDPTLFYMSPDQILSFCHKNCSRYVSIDHAYPLYEFTVTVFHENAMKDIYREDAFKKYFKS